MQRSMSSSAYRTSSFDACSQAFRMVGKCDVFALVVVEDLVDFGDDDVLPNRVLDTWVAL